MLTHEATWSMPPVPTWYRGHQAIRQFLIREPLTRRWQHQPARANGQLAVGCYLFDPAKEKYVAAVIDVLTLDGAKIAAVTGFLAAEVSAELPSAAAHMARSGADTAEGPGGWIAGALLFARFGLPGELP